MKDYEKSIIKYKNERFKSELSRKINEIVEHMLLHPDNENEYNYLKGFKAGLEDAKWIYNNLI